MAIYFARSTPTGVGGNGLNGTSYGNSLQKAFQDAGILTTTHFKDATYLIVTLTKSNKVIKFQFSTNLVTVGDAWTTGSTITNPINLASSAGGTSIPELTTVIVTPDVLVISSRQYSNTSGGHTFTYVFGKLTNGKYMSGGYSTTNYNGTTGFAYYNSTDNLINNYQAMLPYTPLTNPNGTYYEIDPVIMKDSNGVVHSAPLAGVKIICKPSENHHPISHLVRGNDVLVPMGWHANVLLDYTMCIKNGAI